MLNLMFIIDPVTEQMLITCVWPLRCIKDMKLVDIVNRTLDDERFTNTDWIHQFEIRKRTINALQ
jgi:hypothetical protein